MEDKQPCDDGCKCQTPEIMKNQGLYKYRWLVIPVIYLAVCIWTYFTATLEIEGQVLPQHKAGMWALITLHVMALVAAIGAYMLHYLIEGFNWIYRKTLGDGRNNKEIS